MEKEQMEIDPQCVLKMTEDLVNLRELEQLSKKNLYLLAEEVVFEKEQNLRQNIKQMKENSCKTEVIPYQKRKKNMDSSYIGIYIKIFACIGAMALIFGSVKEQKEYYENVIAEENSLKR